MQPQKPTVGNQYWLLLTGKRAKLVKVIREGRRGFIKFWIARDVQNGKMHIVPKAESFRESSSV